MSDCLARSAPVRSAGRWFIAWAAGAAWEAPDAPDWLVPEDRHVTVVFLGQVGEVAARRVWEACPLPAEVWARVEGVACFSGDAGVVRLALPGVVVDPTALRRFAGLGPERWPWAPHVTMRRGGDLGAWRPPDGPVRLGPLGLYVSAAPGGGRRYERVAWRDAGAAGAVAR